VFAQRGRDANNMSWNNNCGLIIAVEGHKDANACCYMVVFFFVNLQAEVKQANHTISRESLQDIRGTCASLLHILRLLCFRSLQSVVISRML
jgi:hypothetical protein